MRFKNIFVLSPGRSGSKTFIEASSHLTNYSAAHESLSAHLGDKRFAYPSDHIEADNRLIWFTGELAKRFSDDVLYINLIRDFDATVDSFYHRLQNSSYRASIMNAFAHGILMKPGDWRVDQERDLAAFGHGLLPGARDLRRAGGRGQHRDGRAQGAAQDAGRA